MDLDYVLSWLVGVSATTALGLHAIKLRLRYRGWAGVCLAALLLLALGLWLWPSWAGRVAGGLWLVAFLAPMWGMRQVQRLVGHRRLVAAERLARVLAVVHPWDGWRDQPRQLRALRLVQSGDVDAAQRAAGVGGSPEAGLQMLIRLHALRAEQRWLELRALLDPAIPGAAQLRRDPNFLLLRLQSLGETGATDLLLQEASEALERTQAQSLRAMVLVFSMAYAGEPERVAELLDGPLRDWGPAVRQSWRAIALQRAGRSVEASALLQAVAAGSDAALSSAAQARLRAPLPPFADRERAGCDPALLTALRQQADDVARYSGTLSSPGRHSYVLTWALMAVNAGAYLPQLLHSGPPPDPVTRWGALVLPLSLVPGEPWRVFTAGFLHFGAVHLVMNLIGLWLLGRYVERTWSPWPLLVVYLAATFGANGVAVLLLPATVAEPVLLLGASGGVMGLLGAALAFLVVQWRRRRLALIRRQVSMFGAILAVQLVFDAFTPRVSSTVHLAGLAIGLLIGGALALGGAFTPSVGAFAPSVAAVAGPRR